MKTSWRELLRKGNPMFWPAAERAMLACAVIVGMYLLFLFFAILGARIPGLSSQLAPQALVRVSQFCMLMVLFWSFLFVISLRVRRTRPESEAPGIAITYLFGPTLLVMTYFNGVHTVATGMMLAATPALGFVMFNSRHVMNAMLLAWLKVIALALIVSQGWLADAPLYGDQPPSRFLSPTWVGIQVLVSFPVAVALLLLTRYIVEALRIREARVRELSRRDALTGIWNRGHLTELLTRETALAERMGWPLSLVVVDLDFFKRINDTHGHAAGDRALITTASVLRNNVRQIDHLGRYGGEEFLIILQNCDEETAETVAERCRRAICENPVEFDGHRFSLTASLGTATTRGTQVDTDRLFHAADQALYRAKESGRNRVVRADQP